MIERVALFLVPFGAVLEAGLVPLLPVVAVPRLPSMVPLVLAFARLILRYLVVFGLVAAMVTEAVESESSINIVRLKPMLLVLVRFETTYKKTLKKNFYNGGTRCLTLKVHRIMTLKKSLGSLNLCVFFK